MRTAWRCWVRTKADIATMLLCAALFSACGGGGGGGGGGPVDTATPRPTSTPVSTATLAPTATPAATQPPTAVSTATRPVPTDTPEPTATGPSADTPTPEPTDTQPAATETPTPLIGPIVTAFGLADNTGTFSQSTGTDASGRPIYPRVGGDDFIIYVEGRPGVSRLPVATNLLSTQLDNPIGQPDLQLVSSQPFGNGSPAVCDKSFPTIGGVPRVDPPDFSFVQSVSDALNDISCRFRIFDEGDYACTQDNSGAFLFANGGSTIQFCALVNDALTLPLGDTVLSVRLRDTAGQAGPMAQIVVRVR